MVLTTTLTVVAVAIALYLIYLVRDVLSAPRQPGRMTQRKPMWLVDVSIASPWRAAGR